MAKVKAVDKLRALRAALASKAGCTPEMLAEIDAEINAAIGVVFGEPTIDRADDGTARGIAVPFRKGNSARDYVLLAHGDGPALAAALTAAAKLARETWPVEE